MKKRLMILVMLVVSAMAAWSQMLPRVGASTVGVSPESVRDFVQQVCTMGDTELHHLMVVKDGSVIAEVHPSPYRAEDRHTLYSVSKTYTALAVGLAVDDNRLRESDRVGSIFPEKLPAKVSANLANMTVRDLLTMSSGIEPNYTALRNNNDHGLDVWLQREVKTPGELLRYDSMVSYALAAIVQKVTGKKVIDLLKERIFAPMGITEAEWEESPDGINTGGWGLMLNAESQAKTGLLINHRGKWGERQLVSAEWIDKMTSKQVESAVSVEPATEGNRGYGYQVWMCKQEGAVRADGAFAQYIVMVPEQDVVVVINGRSGKGHEMLGKIWSCLLPGVRAEVLANESDDAKTLKLCSSVKLPKVKGSRSSKTARKVDKDGNIRLKLTGNRTMVIVPGESEYVLSFDTKEGTLTNVPLGYNEWKYKTDAVWPPYSIQARGRFKGLTKRFTTAGTYAWVNSTTLEMRVEWVGWISARTIVFDFVAQTVSVRDNYNAKAVVYKW